MEISLTNSDKKVLISQEDYDMILKYTWCIIPKGYVVGTVNKKIIRIHRFIMHAQKGQLIDHQNRNKLDNRRENLRVHTQLQNGQNKTISKTKSSKYRGVYYVKRDKNYKVEFVYNKKNIYIGKFTYEIDAAMAFDKYVVNNKIEEIELNFPEKKSEYIDPNYQIIKKEHTSKYIGVYFNKQAQKYQARIVHNKKGSHICFSEHDIDCAKAYDKYVVDNNIPNKKLNFPDEFPNYIKISIIKTEYKEIGNKTIQLIINNNKNAIVTIDKEDYDKVKYIAWYTRTQGKETYVCGKLNGNNIKLHRFLLDATDPNIYVDHADSNTFNNTKKNLRNSNEKNNAQNRRKSKNATSQYYGVYHSTKGYRWLSQVEKKVIGRDRFEVCAARRRDLYILTHLPDSHYKMNFEWTPEDIEMWKLALRI